MKDEEDNGEECTEEEEYALRSHIEAYLHGCAPVHWVNWKYKCKDADARRSLESVLFEDGRLRDLTDATVKAEVLEVISQSPALMEVVIADLAEEVRTITGE